MSDLLEPGQQINLTKVGTDLLLFLWIWVPGFTLFLQLISVGSDNICNPITQCYQIIFSGHQSSQASDQNFPSKCWALESYGVSQAFEK